MSLRRKTVGTALAAATITLLPMAAANAATIGNVWSVVKSPSVTTGTFATNTLLSVSAVSDTNVWAAGFDNKSGADQTGDRPLLEHWNGTAWSVALTGTQNADLRSVSADSATDAWAVGGGFLDLNLLAEHWNGTAWTTASMPVPSDALTAEIDGVTAISPSNAWAVGWYTNDDLGLPLIEHWNGTAWSVVPNVPREVSEFNALHSVTAISANDIWAVGEFSEGGTAGDGQLQMHWDGTSWSVIHPAQLNSGESNAFPVAVAAASSNDVWAVGGTEVTNSGGSNFEEPFAVHWNGTQWTDVPTTPLPSLGSGSFTAVAALSANDVWAVGINSSQSFAEHWDGTSWSLAGLPALGTSGNTLFGIARSGTNSMWAVGDNEPKSTLISNTLTLHTTAG